MVNFEELKSECYGYFKKNSSREFELTQQLEEEGYDTISLTWGMTNYDSLVETFKQLKKPKRFVVLGCSIGYQCFVWNQMYPDIPCVGIDIFEHRVNWGANMIQTTATTTKGCRDSFIPVDRVVRGLTHQDRNDLELQRHTHTQRQRIQIDEDL